MTEFLALPSSGVIPFRTLPRLLPEEFRDGIINGVEHGMRIVCLTAISIKTEQMLLVVMADNTHGKLRVAGCSVGDEYPSLTPACPQAHMFEREIFEQWGIRPLDHPWLKPVRYESRSGTPPPECGIMAYFSISGDEIHEVAVGPVHAGIIEPGHFRFQCHGENVLHLEISLGYQHRGVERALAGGPHPRTIHHIETLAGDTTVGHSLAHSRLIESLSKTTVPPRAHAIRGIAAELERIANHVGDLGALAGDIGFLPTHSYGGRLRGDILNLTAVLCGNRFGRGLVIPGGTAFDLAHEDVDTILKRLNAAADDIENAVGLLWEEPSVLARFENVGVLTAALCRRIGMVGVAARACGIDMDVRRDFPYGIYRFMQIPVMTWPSGDVFARALIRWQEVQRSIAFVREQIASLPNGAISKLPGPLAPLHLAVKLVEGWRGEICHVAVTDERGRFSRYKVVDPSFHNWFGLAYALRNQQISDFPLCNKSFNLSYCGFDL